MKAFYTLLTAFMLYATMHTSVGQVCSTCSATALNSQAAGTTSNNPTLVNTNTTSWSNLTSPSNTGIARFQNRGFYRWEAGAGQATVRIGGLILEEGVRLTLDKQSTNEVEAFDIVGGCIVVKNNAVLDFRYFSALESVNICVEAGGKVIFDSRSTNGQRNDFSFDDVVINLQGPTATLEFGDADLKILAEDGLAITGWTGSQVCVNNTSPPSGTSGNISWEIGTLNICNLLNFNVLPVEWLYLNADFNDKERSGIIKWATAKEWENSHFEIERSVDGVNNFTAIGEVQGMGWKDTVTEYNFEDKDIPLTGGNILYRLKQVDFDGKHAYSKVISVKVANIQYTKGVWRAYPNPTNGQQLKINLLEKSQYQQELITFRIIHPSLVINPITVESEYAMNEYLAKLLPSIPSGVFVVEVAWGQKVEHIKVVK